MPTALTPKSKVVTVSTDPAKNNAAETHSKNNSPLTHEIKNVENTSLHSDINLIEEISSENKISSRADYHKKMKTLYKEFKKEYASFKKDLISFKKRPSNLKAEEFAKYLSLKTKKQGEEPLLKDVFSSLEAYIFSSSDRYDNYRPDRYEMQHLADVARRSDKYISYAEQEYEDESEEQIPRLIYMIAELNELSYNNVSFLIKEKFSEANVIKATSDKKDVAQQRWKLLKNVVLNGKSMGRNYLTERLAHTLFGGKMDYVSKKGFAAWQELNQQDVTAAADFSPSLSSENGKAFNAFFKKRKFILTEEHFFLFLKIVIF